jgi:PIN domain nuclease of toxin-antitoxin system
LGNRHQGGIGPFGTSGTLRRGPAARTRTPGCGFRPLTITFQHALAVRNLPLHHADPFDGMLIAQAQYEDLILVTSDPTIWDYDIHTIDAAR